MVVLYALESDMSRMNLALWKMLGRVFKPGTWKLRVVDLKR
jgi:hypothetical protein